MKKCLVVKVLSAPSIITCDYVGYISSKLVTVIDLKHSNYSRYHFFKRMTVKRFTVYPDSLDLTISN